ncbi:MAG TPA: YDG domain-containing protein [Bryobacteraceae bacterium]
MAGVASAAGANDRVYFPTISPASAVPGQTQAYILRVTNYSQGLCQTCTPLHFIQQIKITVPTGFTLVTPPGAAGPVSTEPNWHVQSISGSPQVITVVTNSTTDSTLVVGKSVNITINAKYTGTTAGCTSSVSPSWLMDVNQAIGGGVGNTYTLAPGASYPKVTVATQDCLTQTKLALTLVTSNGNQSIRTTDTSASLTLKAALTRADNNAGIPSEPITFSLGATIPSCTGLLTDGSGVATCTIAPQQTPYPLGAALLAGTYDFTASFAGDTVPTPDLGGSTSDPEELTVNLDGTGLTASDANGVFGGTVDLKAQLTSQSGSGIPGKTITFFLNGVQVGSTATDSSGWAYVFGVSTAGIDAGPHDNYIKCTFAGDSTYGAVQGLAKLTLSQQSSAISLDNLIQVYTGSPLAPTVTTNPAGLAYSWNGSAPKISAGDYFVTAAITDPNYTGNSASGTFSILRAPVTAHITANDKGYDGTTVAVVASCSLTGVIGSDNVTCTVASAAFASANVASGIVVTGTGITLGGASANNYQLSSTTATTNASITKAGSSVTMTGGTIVYDGASHAATGVAATTAGSLTLPATVVIAYSGSCSSAPTTVAEGTSCTATGTYAGDANHNGSSNTATISITKAGSSVTVTGGTFTYDGSSHTATGSATTTSGALTQPATVTIAYNGSCTSAPVTVSDGSSCTATGTYAGDANHNGSSNTATITISIASQAIVFTAFSVSGSAPGGNVTFSTTSPASVCVVSSVGVVTITGPGPCVVVANQAGDANHLPVTRSTSVIQQ